MKKFASLVLAALVGGVIGVISPVVIPAESASAAAAIPYCGDTYDTDEINIKRGKNIYQHGHGMFYKGKTSKGKRCFSAETRVSSSTNRKVGIEIYKQTGQSHYTRIGRHVDKENTKTKTLTSFGVGNFKVVYYAWDSNDKRYIRTMYVDVKSDKITSHF